jgi:hypothetical protein
MVRHCLRAAAKQPKHGGHSIWLSIAKSIRYRMTFHGARRQVHLVVGHPAGALKEFGGVIRAGGPYAEPSPFHGKVSQFIAMGISGTEGEGKRLGLQKSMKFGAAGGSSYSPTRLHSMPLSRYHSASGSEKIDRFSALIGKEIKKNLPARKRESVWKSFIGSTKLVFTKASRMDITPLYLLVKSCYIPPQKWLPSRDQILMAIVRSFRRH